MKVLLNQTKTMVNDPEVEFYKMKSEYYENFLMDKINSSEIISGVSLHNEYEVIPFCRFTASKIYLVDPGMGKRVTEKPIGFKKKDIFEVIGYGVDQLNNDRRNTDVQYTKDDFLEGMYRTEPSMGSHYVMFFRDIDVAMESVYKRVVVIRPFAPLNVVEQKDISTRTQLINIVLPLSGRTDKFQSFMNLFAEVCINNDKRVFLTVVYFGDQGLSEVKKIIDQITHDFHFKHIKLVSLREEFSRGRGMQVGVQSWNGGDVLMFMCDVDIVFTSTFLEHCRLNSSPGERVYYPMVFSLYNPYVVYSLHGLTVPKSSEQLVISKLTGFWRDFGFGMTCQYRSDFLAIHGFDEQITGWGMEDVLLYRKYVRSKIMVVRSTDSTIFHMWHEKHCDTDLPLEQYRGCIRSKALNEASHAQLGVLAYKDEVSIHRNRKKIKNKKSVGKTRR